MMVKSVNQIKVRKVALRDISAIVRIHKSCMRTANAKAYPKSAVSVWLKQIHATSVKSQLSNSKWIILKLNDKAIGFAQYSVEDETLYQINILPRYSGKGFGRMLYAYIEKEFLKHNARTIDLNATLNAVPFYKKLGFKKVKNISFKLDSVSVKMVEMRKKLHA